MSVNKYTHLSIVYFITRAIFLGVGYSKIYELTGKDAWISMLLGFVLGIFFIYSYHKVGEKTKFNLDTLWSKKNISSRIYQFIFLITYIFLIAYMSLTFTNFVKTYYLFNTPILVTLSLLFSICCYGAFKNENTILRTSSILFIISLVLMLINSFLLSSLVNTDNFLPVLTIDSLNIIKGSIIFLVCSSLPHILLIEHNISIKTKLYSYTFASLSIFIINFFVTSILGEYLITTYSYPEYMVLRRIKFLNFIENIENLASSVLYFDAIFLITLTFNKTKKLLKCPYKFLGLIFILLFSMSYIFTNHYNLYANFLDYGIYISLILLILTGPVLYIVLQIKSRKH